MRIWEKSRRVGATKTDALDSIVKASPAGAKWDVWVIRNSCIIQLASPLAFSL